MNKFAFQFPQMMNFNHLLRLKVAAESGCIDTLYSIIDEDPYVLDHIDQVPFVETPLHVSASAGQIHFSLEIMRLKPSFARKLNPKGYSPMHLALQNNQTETVLRLMDIDSDLVRVHGREGLTPLHIAASEGNAYMLAKFLDACPKSIKEVNIHKETALHIVVKKKDFKSLKVMVERILRTYPSEPDSMEILSLSDEEENSILHIAALTNQIQMVKLLIMKVDMCNMNLEELSAEQIMEEKGFWNDSELRDIVHCDSPDYF